MRDVGPDGPDAGPDQRVVLAVHLEARQVGGAPHHPGQPDDDPRRSSGRWGFQFAGCPSVIASLWPVGDDSTATLMALFYEQLAQHGMDGPLDKLRAFTQARRTLHKKGKGELRWAPFVFLGAPR